MIREKVTGFTLIEVLIAILIAGVGLMGIIALQLKGLQFNHDAMMRSQMSMMMLDVADRIHYSRHDGKLFVTDDSKGGFVNKEFITGQTYVQCGLHSYPVPGDKPRIKDFRNCWLRAVERDLPPGSKVSIQYEAANNKFTIYVGWYDRDEQLHKVEYSFVSSIPASELN